MGQEIERKFLVVGDGWRQAAQGELIRQGYIPTQDARTVRVRRVGDRAYLTLKGPAVGLVRPEFEYPIPVADAQTMLATLCQPPLIEKTRYRLPLGNVVWEIDEFLGENQGLIVAEVELTSADQVVNLPDWIGAEVSYDSRYQNSNLARHPFRSWNA
ncbi:MULTISPECIES: CYTH domain-containing protein [Cyanophyceae]|uniref:CYTH domain-containing protein n=1 Tax=Cyanophyceae TaxID=3028117 RepID=UPI001683BD9F|nr:MULTISPECIES: CYTH domain-containing protein [Cyanophyceae]MBD1914819.1 CYTH domain-containing protein [Phormidium sp. FACHB-77]MBD2029937.1 CYTH domain-containing protein [Phormidium sp. FACHB-322]MBD2049247.1 CYTH domain-containing protein [Leptolyngbya sp. FACHB-60]